MILRGVQTEWLAGESQSVSVSSPDFPRGADTANSCGGSSDIPDRA
jgi:hypothetical protein